MDNEEDLRHICTCGLPIPKHKRKYAYTAYISLSTLAHLQLLSSRSGLSKDQVIQDLIDFEVEKQEQRRKNG